MNLELTLEEARNIIASKFGCGEKDVKIILPEATQEPSPSYTDGFKDGFKDPAVRAQLISDVKKILPIEKMLAIRFVRYRIKTLSLKDAKTFVEMSEVEFNTFIETGRLPDGRILV